MSKTVIGTVCSNREIAEGIYDMWIKTGDIGAQAGQFVNVLCEGGDAFLRRPISICDTEEDKIRLVYEVKGEGTRLLAGYETGRSVDLLAPLGHGFDLTENVCNPIIIGGGIGTYPLLKLAKEIKNPQIFLGFRSKDRITLTDEFEKEGTLSVATDDGSAGYHGLVVDLVREFLQEKKSDMIYACGPQPMLKAVKKVSEEFRVPCQLSMEERMGCGLGACLVCACKTKTADGKENYSHVCKNGPVFRGEEILFED